MKTNHLSYILTAIAGLFVMQFLSSSLANSEPSDLGGSITNTPESSTSKGNAEENTNMPNATNDFYKTIIDKQSGQYAIVSQNKKIVTLKDKSNNVIWSTNVIQALRTVPMSGERKINSMEIINGDLVVTVSRGYALIDKRTGEVKWIGSD